MYTHQINLTFDLLDVSQLQTYLKSQNDTLNSIIVGCAYDEGSRTLTIITNIEIYDQTLSYINNLLGTYTNPQPAKQQVVLNPGLQRIQSDLTEWHTILVYEFQPDDNGTLNRVIVESFGIPINIGNSIEYSVRLVNVTQNNVIGISTFTNTTISNNTINLNGNVNYDTTQTLEIQIKVVSIGTIVVTSAHFVLEY